MARVLIADDEDSMRQLVARAIAMDGHDITSAQDGAEALEILTSEDGAFDLLLTDIQMPVMDGIALVIWRADVVRLLPQTASFYKMVGLDVNLRGLLFKDVKVTTETVEGKQVLVIEGAIVGETRKTVDLPRLRFSVRDAQGAEIYAWNTVLEQTRLKPGDRASFKSRLASPPAEGRSIDVRFFNKRDIAGGSV